VHARSRDLTFQAGAQNRSRMVFWMVWYALSLWEKLNNINQTGSDIVIALVFLLLGPNF
jgi:hypothetical protein